MHRPRGNSNKIYTEEQDKPIIIHEQTAHLPIFELMLKFNQDVAAFM